jgi:hypothetical protein
VKHLEKPKICKHPSLSFFLCNSLCQLMCQAENFELNDRQAQPRASLRLQVKHLSLAESTASGKFVVGGNHAKHPFPLVIPS